MLALISKNRRAHRDSVFCSGGAAAFKWDRGHRIITRVHTAVANDLINSDSSMWAEN